LVAEKKRTIYFVEVKYRSSLSQGSGFDYIANQKLRRMNFAAEIWILNHNWHGDYRLLAASVSGVNCEKIELIEVT